MWLSVLCYVVRRWVINVTLLFYEALLLRSLVKSPFEPEVVISHGRVKNGIIMYPEDWLQGTIFLFHEYAGAERHRCKQFSSKQRVTTYYQLYEPIRVAGLPFLLLLPRDVALPKFTDLKINYHVSSGRASSLQFRQQSSSRVAMLMDIRDHYNSENHVLDTSITITSFL